MPPPPPLMINRAVEEARASPGSSQLLNPANYGGRETNKRTKKCPEGEEKPI